MNNLNILINVICLNKIAHLIYNFGEKIRTHAKWTFHLQMDGRKQSRTREKEWKKKSIEQMLILCFIATLISFCWICFFFCYCCCCTSAYTFVLKFTHFKFNANKRSAICLCLYLTFMATFVTVPSGRFRTFSLSYVCFFPVHCYRIRLAPSSSLSISSKSRERKKNTTHEIEAYKNSCPIRI